LPVWLLAVIVPFMSAPAHAADSRRLPPCPESPNCVSSQAGDSAHYIAPLAAAPDPELAWRRLKAALGALPRLRVVEEDPDYLHAEATSRVFRFVDDVEFLLDRDGGLIHVRSASRTGYSDFGVNRRRVERIRRMLGP